MASESWLEPAHLHVVLGWIKVLKPVGFVEKWHFERGKLAARSRNQNRAKISFIFLNPRVAAKSRFSQTMCKCTRIRHCELPGFSERGERKINYSCPLCKYMAGMKKTGLIQTWWFLWGKGGDSYRIRARDVSKLKTQTMTSVFGTSQKNK